MSKKVLIIILSLSIILLATLFLWKEKLSLSFPINAEKFSAFGTMIASLLTALTVYLLYRQINEQINDRKASNQPDLFPVQVILETHDTKVTFERGDMYVYPQFFRTNNPNKNIKQSSPRVFCSLHNIGLGSAKEIEIEWKYSEKELEDYIDKVYKWYNLKADIQTFDFLAANNSLEVEMPETYMRCCGTQLNERDILTTRTVADIKPKLKLMIKFLDIYNNHFQKTFIVSFLSVYTNVYITFRQDK